MEVVPCQLRRPQGNFWTLENPWKNRWITTHETKTSLDLVACSQLCGRSRLQVYPSAMWRIAGCSRYGGLTPSSTWIGKIEKGWSTMINHHISGGPMAWCAIHSTEHLVVVRTSLESREHRHVDALLAPGHTTELPRPRTPKANGSPPNSTQLSSFFPFKVPNIRGYNGESQHFLTHPFRLQTSLPPDVMPQQPTRQPWCPAASQCTWRRSCRHEVLARANCWLMIFGDWISPRTACFICPRLYIYVYYILHMIKMLVGKDTVYQFKKKMGFNTGNKSLFQSPCASQGLVGGGGHNLNNRDVESWICT